MDARKEGTLDRIDWRFVETRASPEWLSRAAGVLSARGTFVVSADFPYHCLGLQCTTARNCRGGTNAQTLPYHFGMGLRPMRVARLLQIGWVAAALLLGIAGCSSPGQRLPTLVEASYVRMAEEDRQDNAPANDKAPATPSVDNTSIPSNPVTAVAKEIEDLSQGLLVAPASASPDSTAEPPSDPLITQVSCPSCLSPISGSVSHLCSTCESGQCVPGRAAYTPVEKHTLMGQILAELVEIIANPDPCYQPGWIPEANAAFFVDFAPETMVRLRADGSWDLVDPNRAEYFWARDDGKGSGPKFEGITVHPSEPSHLHHRRHRNGTHRPNGRRGSAARYRRRQWEPSRAASRFGKTVASAAPALSPCRARAYSIVDWDQLRPVFALHRSGQRTGISLR